MASLSLPRVLQLKKNSLDAEREQFEKFQTLAIQKAINSVETPVKEKHVRSAIIGTFQEQCAVTYWMVAIRLPLQDNRIVAWKFCHVTHKLLREGHPACLDDSQRHIGMVENLGKLWVHLREGYGKLVHLYCNLLVCKLKFHARNPRFPGNMQLTADELDSIAENDVNNYFQICVELFDYMDDILSLQESVFDSLGNARANSMTASGQCRLAALIPCAQDASQIYDCNVRLLFRLHASLPADTLSGHRERFRQQFKKLSSFYKHASSLQYYRNLLNLPVLPSNPPNFLLQSDFGTYVTPVVSIPDQPMDEVDTVGSLIDTSDIMSQASSGEQFDAVETRATPSPQPDPVLERDRLIEHLQHELRRMRSEVSQRVEERNNILGAMRQQSSSLESKFNAVKSELEDERKKKEMLEMQTPEIKQKLAETEEKAKVTDEKFQKLKGAYTQLREEHINLIRQKAEVDKLSASLRAAAAQHESAKSALQQQLNDRVKDVELLQQSASSSEEIEAYKNEISHLRADLEQSREKEIELESMKAAMEALEIEHNTTKTEQEDKLNILASELKETKETLDKLTEEKEEREVELSKVKQELIVLRESSGDEYKKVSEEKEAALKQIADLTLMHQQEKQEQDIVIKKFQLELEILQQNQIIDKESKETLNLKNRKNEDILKHKDIELKEAQRELLRLQTERENNKEKIKSLNAELNELSVRINETNLRKLDTDSTTQLLILERDTIKLELNDALRKVFALENNLAEKFKVVHAFEKQLMEIQASNEISIEEVKNVKNKEITQLKDELDIKSKEKETLDLALTEKDKRNIETEYKLKEKERNLEIMKSEYEGKIRDNIMEIEILNEKLKTVTEAKEDIIDNLKSLLSEKDNQVILLNIEVAKLSDSVKRLDEELIETQAELEIGKNEVFSLKEELVIIDEQNDRNLALKNQEFRELDEKIYELTLENNKLLSDKEKLIAEFNLEKQVFESNVKEKEDTINHLRTDYQTVLAEKEQNNNNLNASIDDLKSQMKALITEKENAVETLSSKMEEECATLKSQINEKDNLISEAHNNIDSLKMELQVTRDQNQKELENKDLIISEKDTEIQNLEAQLEIADSRRLNSESELQDMLQQHTVLEADIATLKIQLEEAKNEAEKQSSRLVRCAGSAAVQVTTDALGVLEGAEDGGRSAAAQAASALEQLAAHTQVKGNEESVARSAIFAAHSAAQLSAYLAELSNISTDMDLADKLNKESKTMLTATKKCLDSIKDGSLVGSSCVEARGCVLLAAQSASAANKPDRGLQSVDDELAGMDKAIEEAASQIEVMLAASRAGDSGVKLEVNGNILDACTTLMAAVKELVQAARTLQLELGDPTARERLYRKNPQWSEGLISAAKAVVFAAKLLVTSADEAVGSEGRLEGVSAASHEVAASTAQLVAASRARAPPAAPALATLAGASRRVAAAAAALLAATRAASALRRDTEALDTSALTLTATRRLEMDCKVRALELETALESERARLAALRKRHYQLAQQEENGNLTNGKDK